MALGNAAKILLDAPAIGVMADEDGNEYADNGAAALDIRSEHFIASYGGSGPP